MKPVKSNLLAGFITAVKSGHITAHGFIAQTFLADTERAFQNILDGNNPLDSLEIKRTPGKPLDFDLSDREIAAWNEYKIRGVNQYSIAKRFGVAQGTVSKWIKRVDKVWELQREDQRRRNVFLAAFSDDD